MTVNKAYQLLKVEGYIKTDRRQGAFVSDGPSITTNFIEKLESDLELLSAEANITGIQKNEFLKMCEDMYSRMNFCTT